GDASSCSNTNAKKPATRLTIGATVPMIVGMHRTFARFAALPAAIALLAALWAMPAFADPRDFNVVNGTSVVLTHVFVSPSDTQDWGGEIVGREALNRAETVNRTLGMFD